MFVDPSTSNLSQTNNLKFAETAAADLRAGGDEILFLSSHIWCRPYLLLVPDTCFVVDDDQGNAVGYLLGVVDTAEFVRRYEQRYIPYLIAKGLKPPAPEEDRTWDGNLANALRHIMHHPEDSLHPEAPDLLASYPAHIHIDLLPSHQRKGFGRQLIDHFIDIAKHQGANGLHLLMAASNEDGSRFYPKVGFTRFPHVLDDGASGEEGRDKSTIWFVRPL